MDHEFVADAGHDAEQNEVGRERLHSRRLGAADQQRGDCRAAKPRRRHRARPAPDNEYRGCDGDHIHDVRVGHEVLAARAGYGADYSQQHWIERRPVPLHEAIDVTATKRVGKVEIGDPVGTQRPPDQEAQDGDCHRGSSGQKVDFAQFPAIVPGHALT